MQMIAESNAPSSALLTDFYQLTMLQGYFDQGMAETAVFEFFVRKLPAERNFLLFQILIASKAARSVLMAPAMFCRRKAIMSRASG